MALNGEWHGGIRPFGFQADGVTIEPAEGAEILRATEALLAGASLAAIRSGRSMHAACSPSKGNKWGTIEMRDMLMRARNAGKAVYRGEVVGDLPAPAIVPEGSWRGVVALLSDPARRTTPGNKVRWLGSGIYRCGTEDSDEYLFSFWAEVSLHLPLSFPGRRVPRRPASRITVS